MTNEFLDLVLSAIVRTPNSTLYYYTFTEKYPKLTNDSYFQSAIEFLTEHQYIINTTGILPGTGHATVYIATGKGKKLVADGGFVSESNYKDKTLRVAQQARNWSIVAVLLTFTLWAVDRCWDKKSDTANPPVAATPATTNKPAVTVAHTDTTRRSITDTTSKRKRK